MFKGSKPKIKNPVSKIPLPKPPTPKLPLPELKPPKIPDVLKKIPEIAENTVTKLGKSAETETKNMGKSISHPEHIPGAIMGATDRVAHSISAESGRAKAEFKYITREIRKSVVMDEKLIDIGKLKKVVRELPKAMGNEILKITESSIGDVFSKLGGVEFPDFSEMSQLLQDVSGSLKQAGEEWNHLGANLTKALSDTQHSLHHLNDKERLILLIVVVIAIGLAVYTCGATVQFGVVGPSGFVAVAAFSKENESVDKKEDTRSSDRTDTRKNDNDKSKGNSGVKVSGQKTPDNKSSGYDDLNKKTPGKSPKITSAPGGGAGSAKHKNLEETKNNKDALLKSRYEALLEEMKTVAALTCLATGDKYICRLDNLVGIYEGISKVFGADEIGEKNSVLQKFIEVGELFLDQKIPIQIRLIKDRLKFVGNLLVEKFEKENSNSITAESSARRRP